MKCRITISPDPQEPGVAYYLETDQGDGWEEDDSGGWGGSGPRRETTDAWFRLAQRRLGLPPWVKRAGLRWDDADVRPYGWSQGSGHAPQGLTITWTWRA